MAGLQIQAPGGFVPETAISFAAADGGVTSVNMDSPLPVAVRAAQVAASAAALAGSASDSGVFGPFVPDLGRAIWVTLAGGWTGTVTLKRSTDGGTTLRPLTFVDGSPRGVWTTSVNAPVGEESVAGATYHLEFVRSAGTLVYRVEQ